MIFSVVCWLSSLLIMYKEKKQKHHTQKLTPVCRHVKGVWKIKGGSIWSFFILKKPRFLFLLSKPKIILKQISLKDLDINQL